MNEYDIAEISYKNGYEKGYAKGSADAEIALRDIGEWIKPYPPTVKMYRRICSKCGGIAYKIGKGALNYCPSCGRKMRERENTKEE